MSRPDQRSGEDGDPKERTRHKILAAASRLFRERGVEAASLPAIMEAAGLTVGGFYRHFESKEDLFRAALEQAMSETVDTMRSNRGHDAGAESSERGGRWLDAAARIYLDPRHRENLAGGCPLPALTPEVARREGATKYSFERSLTAIVDEIALEIPPGGRTPPRERAWGFLATLVGGLLLARGVADEMISTEILEACRRTAATDTNHERAETDSQKLAG